jgi:hypothetical protein
MSMSTGEIIAVVMSAIAILTTAYKALTDSKRNDVDIYAKAIKPLNDEIDRLNGRLARESAIRTSLLNALYSYLNDRKIRLKDNPYCGSCLGADDVFRVQIQAIILNAEASITKPLKDA